MSMCCNMSCLMWWDLTWFVGSQNEDGTKTEYRVWNPFRSKLAAAILGGVDNIWIVSPVQPLAHGQSGILSLLIIELQFFCCDGERYSHD